MIDHFGLNCADWEKSKSFYDTVLGVLGYTRQMDYRVAIGYGNFVRDPDGNNIEAVFHRARPEG